MGMHQIQADWLDSTVTKLEAFLHNEKENFEDRTITTTERRYLWRVRSKMVKMAAQIREDGKEARRHDDSHQYGPVPRSDGP